MNLYQVTIDHVQQRLAAIRDHGNAAQPGTSRETDIAEICGWIEATNRDLVDLWTTLGRLEQKVSSLVQDPFAARLKSVHRQ